MLLPRAPIPVKITAVPAPPAQSPAVPEEFDSLIVSNFPAIVAEFSGKSFKLLWRESHDGFGASQFHGHCDSHANTLTVIYDREGNTIGGFTAMEWESRKWKIGDAHNS
jgi:hypothetical protein